MVTREYIDEKFGENKDTTPFKTKGVDHDFRAIRLLRERIPYDECKRIISYAAHDIIGLADVDTAIKYISEEDVDVLLDCNVWVDDECARFALFI